MVYRNVDGNRSDGSGVPENIAMGHWQEKYDNRGALGAADTPEAAQTTGTGADEAAPLVPRRRTAT